MDKADLEQTLVLIKPDALKNSLTGYLLSQLSEFHSGLHFSAAKIVHVSKMLAEEHYDEHRGKVFYPSLLDYIMGTLHYPDEPWRRRVIAIAYQGKDAIKKIRSIAGPTNPHNARHEKPGCLRALGTVEILKDSEGKEVGERMDNLIHASAVPEDAEREIKLWFMPSDIPPLMHAYETDECRYYYYYRDGNLYSKAEPESICILTPGEVAWKSDLEILHKISQGKAANGSVETVAAKYLINDYRMEK